MHEVVTIETAGLGDRSRRVVHVDGDRERAARLGLPVTAEG